MTHRTRLLLLAVCVAAAAFAADEGDADRKALAAQGKFRICKQGTGLAVDIALRGDANAGDLFEVQRGGDLIGYAEVAQIERIWPMIAFPIGGGGEGDMLIRVAMPMPKVELLIDDPESRVAKEMKALCGDRLIVEKIGDRMRAPAPDEALVVVYYGGAPFMMGDPIVEPSAARGSKVICDMLAYCHLRGIPGDETFFDQPPSLRIIDVGPLTRGLAEESRIPWYGKREREVTLTKEVGTGSKKKTLSRKVRKLQYVARIATGTPGKEAAKRIATDESTNNTTLVFEEGGGGILACDLITPNGRAGIDPGSKNKLLFVARALGTGPRYSIFRPAKPEFVDFIGEYDALIDSKADRVATTMEGGGSGQDNLIKSMTFGAAGKPLVVLVGCLDGTDWLSTCSILRVAELLLDPEDYKMEWVMQRLRVKIIPCLNMAGYKAGTEANANGVLLDRNLAYEWDAFEDKKARGKEPFSEPETAILKRLVEDDKPIALLDVGVDKYEDGYALVRSRDADDRRRELWRVARDILAARLRHRFVLGDKPLEVPLFRSAARPSLCNWAGSKGVMAGSLRICGDGEDSLINTDVAVEGTLAFLYATALSLEKPPPPPEPKPAPKRSGPSPRKDKVQ